MLKKRIIPVQLLVDGRLVKTVQFDRWRDVGDPVKSSAVYNSQYADELIFLNISRDRRSVADLQKLIKEVSTVCFMPMAMGGGITTAEEAAFLILNGADKIVVNSIAYGDSSVITKTADTFGAQAVVVCVDVRFDEERGDYVLYSDCGRRAQHVGLEEHVEHIIAAGAGEVMIQSIDRDGMMKGFDIALTQRVMAVSTAPVIAAGGSGNYEQMKDAFLATDVSALACGSLFNFSDSNPIRAKAFLSNHGLNFKKV
ncbi:MAG TPA: imidazole glycerol phosphate synthase cyclase subunit [Aurantimonas coralicida]|uniref:Imidazole glycerol phosphate synthase subunit HisF n=2 Tax=root TaxID=1 RepID=A0A9C9NJM1_9HYPH|nr:imidazole glycerol phosphate synthase cyclase subunit [Aurantimonas coralicida]HEU02738.1 imidazole glycerol phosphate synthase cyclase subunit [Aurantimonas coralicida]